TLWRSSSRRRPAAPSFGVRAALQLWLRGHHRYKPVSMDRIITSPSQATASRSHDNELESWVWILMIQKAKVSSKRSLPRARPVLGSTVTVERWPLAFCTNTLAAFPPPYPNPGPTTKSTLVTSAYDRRALAIQSSTAARAGIGPAASNAREPTSISIIGTPKTSNEPVSPINDRTNPAVSPR